MTQQPFRPIDLARYLLCGPFFIMLFLMLIEASLHAATTYLVIQGGRDVAQGKFLLADGSALAALESAGQVVRRYGDESGRPTQAYPANPSGSPGAVAGLCDPTGRIFGLMPHPERHVDPLHHPRWTRHGPAREGEGLRIFRNAVEALRRSVAVQAKVRRNGASLSLPIDQLVPGDIVELIAGDLVPAD